MSEWFEPKLGILHWRRGGPANDTCTFTKREQMAERYARLEQFDCSDGDWKAYQERLEQLFVVNEVEANDEAVRRAALLTVCGRDAYNLPRTLCAPKKPPEFSEESYANLCKKIEEHFNPKPSEVMQRFSFHSRMRTADETVIEYALALRDRLVCGVNDCAIQRRLLSESNLDLTKALEIATTAEVTTGTRHLSHLQATNSDKLTVGHTNAVRSEEPPHARGRGTVRMETDRRVYTIGQGRRRSETRTC